MTARGISFVEVPPPGVAAPGRMDVALFVGLAAPRSRAVPPALARALATAGWSARAARADGWDLTDVPVAVDSWDAFAALYAWDDRPVAGDDTPAITALGAAVRAFFAHGGQRAWIVAMGAPPPVGAGESARIRALERLLYGVEERWAAATARGQLLATWMPAPAGDADRPETWHGLGHLAGLDEVSLLALPDLPDLTAAPAPPAEPATTEAFPEDFATCCDTLLLRPAAPAARAPRHDDDGLALWRRVGALVARVLAERHRRVQLVLAAPLLGDDLRGAAADPVHALVGGCLDTTPAEGGLASAFVQLGWPWLRGRLAERLPEALLPPDGALAGLLAANALRRGTWSSAQGAAVRATAVTPLPAQALRDRLAQRLCLVEPGPDGLRLGSDVTTSGERGWRPGPVSRLLATVVRVTGVAGEGLVFAPSGEETWRQLRGTLEAVLEGLARRGALAGPTPYEVACDRSTMSQADLDAGRLVTRIVLQPAFPVEAIDVLLAGGRGAALAPVGGAA